MRRYSFSEVVGAACAGLAVFAAFLNPAFAASIKPRGAGASSVSGYEVSGISYRMDPKRIDRLAGVSFQLDRPATSAAVSLGGSSASCVVQRTSATCSFASEPRIDMAQSIEISAIG